MTTLQSSTAHAPSHAPAASLLDQVEGYRDRIRLETGRIPSYPDALKALDDGDEDDAFPFPTPRDLIPLQHWLVEAGYTPLAIRGLLGDVQRCGSAWCSSWADEGDLDAIESLVPGVNAYQWDGSADDGTWAITEG